ncbi:hypothetical protein D9758_006887 [Tetrapyrgos nigripes]|uniref:Cytochrome P450 n=1 Tax=Tetrapyrgos nigripes TaxID=182062 RepID=A0A8H5LUZ6_9AGAR|nr:hypothetical protein D9758_006887 [Tetrapyrgos nigripes]
MLDLQAFVAVALALGATFLIANPDILRRPAAPLPPGPKGTLFFGNLFQIPPKRQYLQFAKWKEDYGDVMKVKLLRKTFIILNSRQAVQALFVKRSNIYSDRPALVIFEKYSGWNWSLPGLHYGDEMMLHRRLLNSGLSTTACKGYFNDMLTAALKLALKAGNNSETWAEATHLMVAGNILKMTYGYDVQEKNDPWMDRAEKILHLIQDLGPIGTHPADVFPWLANLPARFFGQKFANNMHQLRQIVTAVWTDPYNDVKQTLDSGKERPCFTADMISQYCAEDGKVEHEHAIRATAATNYTVGVETVESSLNTFAIAMMLNPDVQKRAQAEIDDYFHGQRLPTLEDRGKLPYVEAVMWEVLRWQPATPMAVARMMAVDDVYNGFLIPKGKQDFRAAVMANSWQCLHDPTDFPNPHAFIPDRFIPTSPFNPNIDKSISPPDPRDFAFGYGRRACVGRPFAEATLWMGIAMLLATVNFEVPKDEFGKDIFPNMEYESGVAVQFPKPFKTNIKFRSKVDQDLIQETLDSMGS